ncbi:MAG: bifunctional hydroxymethylpyrimidine kinase/phosphomethylpyrimidine kinase [Candidatus Binatia bacterium]
MRSPGFVLAIAGFDPSCGAGVQADLRTLDALGVNSVAALTAITVQAGHGVCKVRPVSAALVGEQIDEVLSQVPVSVVKCGQTPTEAIVLAVAKRVAGHGLPLVLDPVLEAGEGGSLVGEGVARALQKRLFPVATVLTVNLAEAASFSGFEVDCERSMAAAAKFLAASGPRAVVVKGGHLEGEALDLMWDGKRLRRFPARRREGPRLHGTGCAFASAVAAGLARGRSVASSVRAAGNHVRSLIDRAEELDGGVALRRPPLGRRSIVRSRGGGV